MGETMNFGDPHEIFSILILGNMALIGFGALHYFLPSLHSIGRSIRLTGISVGLIFLFILSFFHTEWGVNSVSDDISIFAIVLASLCIILEGFSLFRTHIENKIIEGGLILLLSITMLLNVLNYSVWNYYAVNVEFVAVLVGLFYLGHKRRDMTLVNIGLVWTIAFICGKYFDYFWDLLPKSLYFLIGGALLVGTGFVLEKKRSSLAKHYEAQ